MTNTKISSKHVDCIYPRQIKQQSNLLNGVGFGVIIISYVFRIENGMYMMHIDLQCSLQCSLYGWCNL